MTRSFLALFFLLLNVLISLSSQAQTAPSKCIYVFRVGLVFNEPLYFLNGPRQLTGSSLEVIKELRRRTGCEFIVEEFTRPSLIERFRRSLIDMSVISIRGRTMDSVAQFIHLYNSPRAMLLTPSIAKTHPTLQKALDDKKIVFGNIIGTQNYYSDEEVSLLRKANRLRDYPDYQTLFSGLIKGQIQGVIGSLMITNYYQRKLKLDAYVMTIDDQSLTAVGCYIDGRRLKPEQIEILKGAFNQMLKDKTFVNIYAQYSSQEIAERSILPLQ